MFTSNCFNNEFENLNVVTCFQNISIFEINFVLSNRNFVVTCFNFKSHFSQHVNDFTTCVISKVCWCKVKITTAVVYFKSWFTFFIQFEQEEFWFWTKVK